MKNLAKAGKYVIAVSGGVDSVVLLDLLTRQKDLELVVAHFNHGIRADADIDEKLVVGLAKKYNLDFVIGYGELGANASEDQARQARYDFLRQAQKDKKADGLITAHHKDDLLETAISNLLRGTSGRGMQSMLSNPQIIRPLIEWDKAQILEYAKSHKLKWREDSTNLDTKYFRNYIRHNVLAKFSLPQKKKLHTLIYRQQKLTTKQDDLVIELINLMGGDQLDKKVFIGLPHDVSLEVMAGWLRSHKISDFNKPTIERLVVSAKTAKTNSMHNVQKDVRLHVSERVLKLTNN